MGNDYWCAGPDQAAQVFADEFGGLASVVAQNVSVEIAPSDAVAATAVLNEFPITDLPGHRVQVALGDAYGGERRKLVAKFHLRPVTTAGMVDVATLTIRWAATTGDVALHTVTVPVVIAAGDAVESDPGADREVTEEVLRLEVARTRRQARDAAERGDYGTASQLMSSGADMLTTLDAPSVEIDEFRADAFNLMQGDWSPMDSKRNFSRSRSSTEGSAHRLRAAGGAAGSDGLTRRATLSHPFFILILPHQSAVRPPPTTGLMSGAQHHDRSRPQHPTRPSHPVRSLQMTDTLPTVRLTTAVDDYVAAVFREVVRVASIVRHGFDADDIAAEVAATVLDQPELIMARYPDPLRYARVRVRHAGISFDRRERAQRGEGARLFPGPDGLLAPGRRYVSGNSTGPDGGDELLSFAADLAAEFEAAVDDQMLPPRSCSVAARACRRPRSRRSGWSTAAATPCRRWPTSAVSAARRSAAG